MTASEKGNTTPSTPSVSTENIASNLKREHTLSDEQIQQVEQLTKGQSDNSFLKQIQRFKATASTFGKIIKCSRNPDGLLKAIFYSEAHSLALSYGKENEEKAIEDYKQYMDSKGSNVQVESVSIILSEDRPGLGPSLDGIVVDPSANITRGGLEMKCPYSKANFNINDACKDKTLFLKSENGQISLKENHNYFYQVQGQMYVANLKWVDFVVWFGDQEELFVQLNIRTNALILRLKRTDSEEDESVSSDTEPLDIVYINTLKV
ncbi:unnamed protein product [Mytilus coruscus]|uniref:YqaJ viral recombinase domain-containing protein n=1 Tax=Mytilus coruscus TaxID=42192 RepID=A0A6J8CPN9_MYTCO|nr:unnamed protein product [Mytilus coruscus]